MRTLNTDSLPTRASMRPRTGRRLEVRRARRQDRSTYSRREY